MTYDQTHITGQFGLGSAVLQDIQYVSQESASHKKECITPKAKISKEDLDKLGLIDTSFQDGCVKVFHRLTQVKAF
jgi:hypothetical protein